MLFCALSPALPADPLARALDAAQAEAAYVAPPAAELSRVEAQFAAELAGQAGNWEALGMARRSLEEPQAVLVVEQEDQRRGRGLFAFRSGDGSLPWLLQAPHQRNDAHTGVLARRLFSEGKAAAAMWNTVSRRAEAENGSADLAHLPQSYWQSLTQAFAQRYPQGRIIQLHGFDSLKRKSEAGFKLGMIVSAGHARPPAWVRDTAACLKDKLQPYAVGLYPDDIHELGGTTNAQGQLLRAAGHDGFLHLEMSLALREQLVHDAQLRGRLADCLASHAG